METIALVVTITTNIYSGGMGGTSDFTNTYAINGFASKASCEAAKPVEIARMKRQLKYSLVDAACVVYPAK